MNANGIIALGLLSAIQGWIQGIFTFTELSLRYLFMDYLWFNCMEGITTRLTIY